MKESIFCEQIKYKGEPCIQMRTSQYTCLIAPRIGSNIIRLHDTVNNIELVNFKPKTAMWKLRLPSVIYGMPSMLYPNRLGDGTLRTSDGCYQFPINEGKLNNYIHGFIHARQHKLIDNYVDNENKCAVTKTQFVYDENDPLFNHFPLKFTIEFTFILNEKGLRYTINVINNSDKMFPLGLGNHTSIRAPFVKGARRKDIRIQIPVKGRVELNERWLATGKLLPLSDSDKLYLDGSMCPVLHNIDNEMFEIGSFTLQDEREIHGILISDQKSKKSIIYEVDSFYKYFILWNCGGNASFFCPEPISWLIDAPNIDMPSSATGYRELKPGESFCTWQQLSSYIIK